MSAIFGIVHLDGSPVPAASIEHLSQAHARWGRDRHEIWSDGSAVLGVAMQFNTPEAHHAHMPAVDPADGSVAAIIARLDNRDELCDAFNIPAVERPVTADAALAHLAYRRWGEACAEKLFGDWSMAMWQPRERRLFLAHDHLNATALYYYHRGPLFAFASDSRALAHTPEIMAPLDEWQLARYLTLVPGEIDRTMWQDVRLLRPAHTLVCTVDSLRTSEYWRPENARPVRLRSTMEYVEAFLDHYRRAVRVRLRSVGGVGSTLSAGLDSSSVTALAAEALGAQGSRLTAFTSVPVHAARHLTGIAIADEGPLAAETAKWWRNVDHVMIRGDDWTPVAALERSLQCAAEPVLGPANLFWLLSVLSAARGRALGAVLVAHMGNSTVSWGGGNNRHLYLFAHGRWIQAMQALASWRAAYRTSWATTVRYQLFAPLLAPAWRQRRRFVRAEPAWAHDAALNPAFARRLGLDREMGQPLFGRLMRPERERVEGLKRNAVPAGMLHPFGAAFGIDLRDPTADVRLTEYCLGVPIDQYAGADGTRLLVRRAMSGLLPHAVQWNVQRGRQGADVAFRVLDHPAEMTELLTRLERNPSVTTYIDLPRMRAIWHALEREGVTPRTFRDLVSVLMRGLMAAVFIERQTEFQPQLRATPLRETP